MNGEKRNCISIPDTANAKKGLDDGNLQMSLKLKGYFRKRKKYKIGVKRATPYIETLPPCQFVNPSIVNSTFERAKRGKRAMKIAIKETGCPL